MTELARLAHISTCVWSSLPLVASVDDDLILLTGQTSMFLLQIQKEITTALCLALTAIAFPVCVANKELTSLTSSLSFQLLQVILHGAELVHESNDTLSASLISTHSLVPLTLAQF